jgi:hypothetical protein
MPAATQHEREEKQLPVFLFLLSFICPVCTCLKIYFFLFPWGCAPLPPSGKKKEKKKSRGKANAVWLYTRNVFLPCSSRSSLRENGAIISQLFKSLLFSVSSHKSHTKTESQSLFVLLFQQKFYSQTSAFTFFSKLQLRQKLVFDNFDVNQSVGNGGNLNFSKNHSIKIKDDKWSASKWGSISTNQNRKNKIKV